MRLKGKEISVVSRKLSFPRPDGSTIDLQVRSIPIGWDDQYKDFNPRPPVKMQSGVKNGEPFNKPIYDDPVYLVELAQWKKLEIAYLIWRLIRDTPGLEFATTPTNGKTLEAWWVEFSESGLSELERNEIVKMGNAASLVTAEEVAAARENFA
jgi:hypothetical protein